jgi:hypothetical protein
MVIQSNRLNRMTSNIEIKPVKKIIKIVSRRNIDADEINAWISLSYQERISQLEKMRQEINARLYGNQSGFQRVFRITQRAQD